MDYNKKALVGAGMIKGVIVGLIMLTILLSIAPTLIHTSQEAVQDVATEFGNSTLYGTGASTIGAQVDDYSGYFWVIGVFLLVITVVLAVFKGRR